MLDAGIQSDRNDRDESWGITLREQLNGAEVELSSVIARRRMSLRELTKLKVGDILPIDMLKEVPLCVEGLPVFTGEFGVANDRNAIKIIAAQPPGVRQRPTLLPEDAND